MRYGILILVAFFLNLPIGNAQDAEKEAVKKVVEGFFEAFHKQDSLGMKSFVGDNVVLQTTGRNKEGKTMLRTTPIGKLYESIVSIPDSVSFEEKLTSWNIQVDRTMANAWVGYEFWLNGNFSHCGINSFQMVDFDGQWKIIYLIDTRGRAGCLEE
ncbi:nuclear transport factor 2 family protein [Muricauda sp. SCSIO 64092]|uniref:nuclear transport factor 2 family protein n=1 Tax=Allomuricauda sp. SCSIO 64092 TaxID=2908842 RepID=UPI001FF354D1|nr:nuclear transport factor 2 family protein [Muricauda sp. SCSIO 64092]UOY06877.1 nuclear transport factor 2 family protein [Muricauda sp. SCSIO 64092]